MADAPIASLILAAGSSTRFRAGDPQSSTKAVALLDGAPLVRHVARAALAAGLGPVMVVTGFGADDVAKALDGLPVTLVHNGDFARGLASSLRCGLAALPPECAGAVVLLADMPKVSADLLVHLAQAFRAGPGAEAAVPVYKGAWGNPALIGRALFAALSKLEGDEGARRVLRGRPGVVEVPVEDEGVAVDVDTPDALAALGRDDGALSCRD